MSTAAEAAATQPVTHLLEPATIRERCASILAAVEAGGSKHFRVDRSRLADAAALVEQCTRRRYPDLRIPYHSRWRHFEAGGVDRAGELSHALNGRNAESQARARIDLTVISVLLDAGAGPSWLYREAGSGQPFTRSEGLGVASFRAFMAGRFSANGDDPCRVEASALQRIDAEALGAVFQVDTNNPLVGLEGRAALLRRLGDVLEARGAGDAARPSGLCTALLGRNRTTVGAETLLRALLDGLGPIWLAGITLEGVALGDCWRHPLAGGEGVTAGWVPFHKLSQWLTYSLFEPFEWSGLSVIDKDVLTGLPEYRNGGLLLDTDVLSLVDPAAAERTHDVGSELIVEWRALTVALIDALAVLVRERLGRPELPLACILEGGTWAAGRELAQMLRNGNPPLSVRSDGTVF